MIPRSCILLALAAIPALADPGDPPSRVARINYETGPVSFRPGAIDDWSAAEPNYPLTAGDHLWADLGGVAEIHAGSTAIRMSQQTALAFLNLDDRTVQLSLTQGVIQVRIRDLRPDEIFEVDTPNAAITLLRPGEYRIRADGDRAITEVAVRGGDAEVTGSGTAFPVHPRQAAQIMGPDGRNYQLVDLAPPDAFESWCEDRDRREEQIQSVRYVPREMIGYEDLDGYGAWRNVPPYGWVWTPTRVVAGWAPYRYGHWVWVAPWGWTWVDDSPWGFAPFHYGRWALVGGAWIWAPGRIVERPVYAPALVAFVGGPGFNLAIVGGAGVAWFPLGPGEVYRPAYHVSEVYVRNINITHVTVTNINVTNVRYVNQSVQGAVTAAPQQAFVSARPIGQVATVISSREAAQAQVVGTTAAVAPRPESIVSRSAALNTVARPPAQVMQRTVAVRTTPPPPPLAFRAQQQALATNQGRPLDNNTLGNLRTSGGATPNAPPIRAAAPANLNNAPAVSLPRNDRPPAAAVSAPGNPAPGPPLRNDRPAPAAVPAAGNPPPNYRPAPAAAAPAGNPPAYERPAPAASSERRPAPAAESNRGKPAAKKEQKKEERKEER